MKIILKIVLCVLLVDGNACSQNMPNNILLGEWLMKTNYEAPDLLIFRSDNKYLVFNDMDFVGIERTKASDIILDDSTVTALTETGTWSYDKTSKQLILTDRNFIKKKSEFNTYHGKKRKLVLQVKSITNKEMALCVLEKENFCDIFIKNANFTGKKDEIFYEEIAEKYFGIGTKNKKILLSGHHTILKLRYNFYEAPGQLVIEDKKGRELFTTAMIATKGIKQEEITLRGITKLTFKVKTNSSDTKWKIRVDIK